MVLKVLGALMIVGACGGFGVMLAVNHRANIRGLYSLMGILDHMECELNYRLTPLPQLCRQVAADHKDPVGKVFSEIAEAMDKQVSSDVSQCMGISLRRHTDLPSAVTEPLDMLGKSLGRFDLSGQLQGIAAVRKSCRSALEELERNKDDRLRGYRTLSLCAGAALAIILM